MGSAAEESMGATTWFDAFGSMMFAVFQKIIYYKWPS
jgi:hypothetical protein